MERAVESSAETPLSRDTCDNCLRILNPRWSFGFKIKLNPAAASGKDFPAELTKCLRCTLRHRPMLKKSLAACVVVGTLLTALNQGDILLAGEWNSSLWWKIPLTYAVPFTVATIGGILNARTAVQCHTDQ